MPDFDSPQVAIGTLDTWHDTQVLADGDLPALPDQNARARPLLPGAKEWRYWKVDVALDGGQALTVRCRLLVSHLADSPEDSVPLQRGDLPCWIKVSSADEDEIVRAGTLSVGG